MSNLRWYLSLRSPYSWLAIRTAQAKLPRLWNDSELRVFFEPGNVSTQRDPTRATIPYTPMSKVKHLYILRDVKRIGNRLGLTPTWPVEHDPQWEIPSLPLIAALRDDPNRGRQFAVELTAARWEHGLDILDRNVVASCAARSGLEANVADAVDNPKVQELSLEVLDQVNRDGVFGVPMVIVGREPFWGLDRLVHAAQAYGQDGDEQSPDGLGSLSSIDSDHAGGCG